jgi:hypothetical protein
MNLPNHPSERRSCLRAGLSLALWPWAVQAQAASGPAAWRLNAWAVPEPLVQLRPSQNKGWLAVSQAGGLWALYAKTSPQKLATGLDPFTPLAAAHDRVVARRADGRCWISERGTAAVCDVPVAAHAGFVILPFGVIAAQAGAAVHLVRLEPGAGSAWKAIAKSREPVLPDAQPVQVALDSGGGGGDAGHIAVLAGPDGTRYRHGVLGDEVEATRVLYLERHDLSQLSELTLPAPHVFEDNRLRVWRSGQGVGLVTVRSGPQGAQLALIEADRAKAGALRVAALGDPIGTPMRWMSPSTDGERLVTVQMPHLAGTLQAYRREGERLVARVATPGWSNHVIGAHELDVSAWLGERFVSADSARRALRTVNADTLREAPPLSLPQPLRAISADAERRALAVLLADGSMHVLEPA